MGDDEPAQEIEPKGNVPRFVSMHELDALRERRKQPVRGKHALHEMHAAQEEAFHAKILCASITESPLCGAAS